MSRARVISLLLLPAIALIAAATAYAAFRSSTSNTGSSAASGTVYLSDNDSGAAMFSMSNSSLGATASSCMRETFGGSLASNVRHYGSTTGTLGQYLTLKVTRGSGASTFGSSCTGFTADSTDYAGHGAGVIYNGHLSDYPTSYTAGVVDPADGVAGTYSSTVSATSGLVNYYRLGDSPTTYSSDTFTGTAGTSLQSHTGEVGATWTVFASSSTAVLTDANRVRRNTTTPTQYYASATPSSANYTVEGDVTVKSLISGDAANVIGRQDTSNTNGTYYAARYLSGDWELLKLVNGTVTVLDTSPVTLTSGQTYNLQLSMNGSSIALYVDGTLKASATDSAITAAGKAGIRMGTSANPTAPTNTTGLHMDNFVVTPIAQTADDSQGTNDGTYTNGVTEGASGALPGDSDTAATFDGVDDYVSLTRQISDNFSIELWFKSTQGLNTAAQWWGNAGLVDADTGSTTNDFGLSLRSDGKIAAGTGNPDTSITSSSSGYDDGNWHHVVFTRTKSTGALNLYVDGSSAASGTSSNTASLTATATIHVGKIQSGTNYFDGSIDELALYSAALTSTQVAEHYAATVSPEAWTTSETHDYKFQVTVDNNPSAVGLSGTASFISEARNT